MGRQIHIFVIAITILIAISCYTFTLADENTKQVRLGVYVRSGFDACLDEWTPVANYLTRTIPGYHFSIIPLASREDVFNALEKKQIDLLAANAAIYVCTEQRFRATAICGMIRSGDPSGHDCTGCLIRRADRNDLANLYDLSSARLSAVKLWSFSGWIMQWQLLRQHKIDPLRNDSPVLYEGTHQEVIHSVLDGDADVGAVATDILNQQIKSGEVDPKSLWVFNRQGEAIAIEKSVVASTRSYPDWVLARTPAMPNSLAEKVFNSLMSFDRDLSTDSETSIVAWTVPQNYQLVRDTLRDLMGADYAYADTMSPHRRFATSGLVQAILSAVTFALAIIFFIAWRHIRRRNSNAREELRIVHAELNEVRASKNLIETILTKVKCGMDIINEKNEIIYVTPGIEHRYGPWRGKRCYEYYWGSSVPCKHCTKRAASEHRKEDPYIGSCHVTLKTDHHPIGGPSGTESESKLLQVPFYDENGQWLYARVHLPPESSIENIETENMIIIQR